MGQCDNIVEDRYLMSLLYFLNFIKRQLFRFKKLKRALKMVFYRIFEKNPLKQRLLSLRNPVSLRVLNGM